jgi:hypothetical protein
MNDALRGPFLPFVARPRRRRRRRTEEEKEKKRIGAIHLHTVLVVHSRSATAGIRLRFPLRFPA